MIFMKKTISLVISLLCIAIFFCACDPGTPEVSQTPDDTGSVEPTDSLNMPTPTPDTSDEPLTTPTEAPTPSPTPTRAPTPTNTARMYSSWAHMVSFDPSTGWAEFDYWDMLRGEEAVAWKVANEGLTEAEAQEIVDNFADSEYVYKNTNTTLRTIDLSTAEVWMLEFPFGYDLAPDPDPVLTSYADLCALYATDPDILLGYFYYYVTVNADGSIKVAQCYWP